MTTRELLRTQRQAVRESFGRSEKYAMTDIETIKEWFKTQPHLPEIPSDNMIEMFLATNKYSIERTKEKLDMYYTIRALIPELYDHCNLGIPQMIHNDAGIFVTLPKQTKDMYRVSIMKIRGPVEDFDVCQYFAHMLNHIEVRLQHDISKGEVFILDHVELKLGHVLKMTPLHVKRITTVLEAPNIPTVKTTSWNKYFASSAFLIYLSGVEEHTNYIKRREFEKSKICEHAWENGHLIQWDSAKILEKEDNAIKRKLKETAIILLNGDKYMSKCSVNIDHCWLQLYQEEKVFSNRMKGMHVINYLPFVDILMTVSKAAFKPKLFARIHLHNNLDELYEHVPKDILPVDYGGQELSVKELNELWNKYLRQHSDRFQFLQEMKVKEELRPAPLDNDELLGYHGNFKKLDVD